MTTGPFVLRAANADELDVLRRIDDDASSIFEAVGIALQLTPSHPFVAAELERWRVALRAGRGQVAVVDGVAAGFLLLGEVDGAPYVEQVSVAPPFMGRGIGRALLQFARAQTEPRPLWLTTYAHVPWNAPFYERLGFVRTSSAGPEVWALLREQRAALPFPEQRVAMVQRGASQAGGKRA